MSKKNKNSSSMLELGEEPTTRVEEPKVEEPKVEEEQEGYVVAPKKAISCGGHRTIIDSGEAIEPKDLHADEVVARRNFDDLLNSGHIVKA